MKLEASNKTEETKLSSTLFFAFKLNKINIIKYTIKSH